MIKDVYSFNFHPDANDLRRSLTCYVLVRKHHFNFKYRTVSIVIKINSFEKRKSFYRQESFAKAATEVYAKSVINMVVVIF